MLRYILRYIFLSVFAVLLIRFFALPACGEIGLVSENVRQLKSSGECTFCDLGGANLTNATLDGANLYAASLSQAKLRGANLSYANLYGANLYIADLSYANLRGANLTNATLNGAYLYGADLTDANLDGASLDRVIDADFNGALNVPAKYWKN